MDVSLSELRVLHEVHLDIHVPAEIGKRVGMVAVHERVVVLPAVLDHFLADRLAAGVELDLERVATPDSSFLQLPFSICP